MMNRDAMWTALISGLMFGYGYRRVAGFQTGSFVHRTNPCLSMELFINGAPDVPLNGDILDGMGTNEGLDDTEAMPVAPALTYDKFLTMQEKRVVVTIRYTGGSGLKPYYLTVAKKLKASHPDVLIEKRILPALPSDGSVSDLVFEILVDGKVVVGTKRTRKPKSGVDDITGGKSVYISMQELDISISKARRRRRPSTLYGEKGKDSLGLNMLRKETGNGQETGWND